MNDRRLLAWVVVLALFVALVGTPAISSARMFLRDDTIGEVDIECLKGGEGNQGDDDAWASGGGPPAIPQEKASGGGRGYEEAQPTDGRQVTPVLPLGILIRLLFARLFVL